MNRDLAKVKHLSVVLIFLGLFDSKYPSKQQAWSACREWAGKGVKITYTYKLKSGGLEKNVALNRLCRQEEETQQYLGLQGIFLDSDRKKDGRTIYSNGGYNIPKANNFKVVKNFRY